MSRGTELRCPNTLHGILADGYLEVKCRNRRCGAGMGRVVIHKFDIETGKCVFTQVYQDPVKGGNGYDKETPIRRQGHKATVNL